MLLEFGGVGVAMECSYFTDERSGLFKRGSLTLKALTEIDFNDALGFVCNIDCQYVL